MSNGTISNKIKRTYQFPPLWHYKAAFHPPIGHRKCTRLYYSYGADQGSHSTNARVICNLPSINHKSSVSIWSPSASSTSFSSSSSGASGSTPYKNPTINPLTNPKSKALQLRTQHFLPLLYWYNNILAHRNKHHIQNLNGTANATLREREREKERDLCTIYPFMNHSNHKTHLHLFLQAIQSFLRSFILRVYPEVICKLERWNRKKKKMEGRSLLP